MHVDLYSLATLPTRLSSPQTARALSDHSFRRSCWLGRRSWGLTVYVFGSYVGLVPLRYAGAGKVLQRHQGQPHPPFTDTPQDYYMARLWIGGQPSDVFYVAVLVLVTMTCRRLLLSRPSPLRYRNNTL